MDVRAAKGLAAYQGGDEQGAGFWGESHAKGVASYFWCQRHFSRRTVIEPANMDGASELTNHIHLSESRRHRRPRVCAAHMEDLKGLMAGIDRKIARRLQTRRKLLGISARHIAFAISRSTDDYLRYEAAELPKLMSLRFAFSGTQTIIIIDPTELPVQDFRLLTFVRRADDLVHATGPLITVAVV